MVSMCMKAGSSAMHAAPIRSARVETLSPDAAVHPQARPPCLPDFILRVQGEPLGHPVVIVDTMGYADQAYRERKGRMHGIMSSALDGAPVVDHDFGQPEEMTQEERNKAIGRKIIKLVLKAKAS